MTDDEYVGGIYIYLPGGLDSSANGYKKYFANVCLFVLVMCDVYVSDLGR